MGEMAELSLWEDDYINDENSIYNLGYWIMKDGTIIAIEKMELSHLKNTINYLKKRGLESHPAYGNLVEELNTRLAGT